ncbi:hypothetical protein [Microbacterium sp. PMB16]
MTIKLNFDATAFINSLGVVGYLDLARQVRDVRDGLISQKDVAD